MGRFVCVNGSENLQISPDMIQELVLTAPEQLHLQADRVVEVARRVEKSGWLRLPFCSTLCGEALGAKPVLDMPGARVKEPPYQKVEELPAAPDWSVPRLEAMFRALETLTAEEGQVAYNIEGAFTLLCTLLPMNRVFSALRKPAGEELLRKAEDWVCAYAARAVERGARVLSFADPVATIDILGERMFTSVYVPCLKRLLMRLRQEHPHVPIHLCGKLTQCLLDIEGCRAEAWQDAGCETYGQALTAFCKTGEGGIVGHFCLNFLGAKRPYLTLIEF